MVIKVNTSELQSKSSYAKSIASRLGEEVSKINSLYYNVDPKVRNRQSIGSSIRNLQQRLERAQQKMYNISSFLAVTASQYSDAESIIIARLNGLDAVRATNGDFTSGVSEGKKWYNSNIFKIAVGAVVIGVAVAAVVMTGGAAIAVAAAVGAGIGALGGGVVGGVVSKVHGGNFIDGFADGFMAGAIGGAVSGAVGATSVGFWGAAAIDGGTDSLIYTIQTLQNDGQITIGGLTTSFAVGMGFSAISSGISSRIRNKGGSQTVKEGLSPRFKYKNNPMENPKAAKDIIENPDAVYGFSPNPKSESIGGYADAIDWTDPEQVAQATARRQSYHDKNDNIVELVNKMRNERYSTEDIARAVNNQRNQNRLNDYINDPEGLERVMVRNAAKYDTPYGPSAEFSYNKYGSWEKVIEKSMSANPGMDACCGLYDKYYHLYEIEVNNNYHNIKIE